MKTQEQTISEMAKELKYRYTCIMKLDALKFLKSIYPNVDLNLMVEAYNIAYED